MFTASIKSKSFFNGEFKVEVQFTNGTDTFTDPAQTIRNQSGLNNYIRNRIIELNELETLATTLTVGSYVPVQPVAPTVAETEKQEWFRDFSRLERVKRLAEVNGMPGNWAADLAALETKVQTNAKKAYIADF